MITVLLVVSLVGFPLNTRKSTSTEQATTRAAKYGQY